jgi:hypothetical protein
MNGLRALIEYGNRDREIESLSLSEHSRLTLPILYTKLIFNDKCCVCNNISNCMTECSHELCVICVKKVKKCPICRENLTYYYVNK